MLTKKHIKDAISSNRLLIRQHGISKIGLFGSYILNAVEYVQIAN